jgi:hypothetical protein
LPIEGKSSTVAVEADGDWLGAVGEKSDEAGLARRRGSFLGRNLKGVWKTDAADEGGLKMISLVVGRALAAAAAAAEAAIPFGLLVVVRKDGCGAMLRARLVRADVDFWRAPGRSVLLRSSRLDDGAEDTARRQQDTAGLVTRASMMGGRGLGVGLVVGRVEKESYK